MRVLFSQALQRKNNNAEECANCVIDSSKKRWRSSHGTSTFLNTDVERACSSPGKRETWLFVASQRPWEESCGCCSQVFLTPRFPSDDTRGTHFCSTQQRQTTNVHTSAASVIYQCAHSTRGINATSPFPIWLVFYLCRCGQRHGHSSWVLLWAGRTVSWHKHFGYRWNWAGLASLFARAPGLSEWHRNFSSAKSPYCLCIQEP